MWLLSDSVRARVQLTVDNVLLSFEFLPAPGGTKEIHSAVMSCALSMTFAPLGPVPRRSNDVVQISGCSPA